MKHHKNRVQESLSGHEEVLFAEELHVLADVVAEVKDISNLDSLDSDPFDAFMDSMGSKIFSEPRNFRARFIKGYNTLIHCLEQAPPPKAESKE